MFGLELFLNFSYSTTQLTTLAIAIAVMVVVVAVVAHLKVGPMAKAYALQCTMYRKVTAL